MNKEMMNKYICVLTYNHPHQKTQDLLFHLKIRGIKNVIVTAIPWIDRKTHKPLLPHRPSNNTSLPMEELCSNLDYGYQLFSGYSEIYTYFGDITPRYILIGGAGILPKDLVKRWKIFNSHPGWLPNVRGLDALKWAIWEGEPIGVTTHICDVEADTGLLIRREEVTLHLFDTFYSVAQRQYDLEIRMLADSITDFVNIKTKGFEKLNNSYIYKGIVPSQSTLNSRMPAEKEKWLEELLRKRILEYCSNTE